MKSSDKLQSHFRFKSLLNVIKKNIIVYTQVIIYEKRLDNIPSVNTKIDVSVKRASLDDIRKMFQRDKNNLAKKLKEGHVCFIAERKGDILGYCWVAFRELYVREIDRKIKFKKAEACIYDVFVFPDYRRKRIYQKMLVEIFRFLRKKGYEKVFINVLSTNIPSKRGVEHVGFKRIKNVIFFRLFGLSVRRTRAC